MRPAVPTALFVLLAGAAPAALALAPKAASPVAVVAPWAQAGEAARIVAAANGTITGATHGGTVAIARSAEADFVTRLYRSGAWLVLDAQAVAACLKIESDNSQPRIAL